jgi:hypothetical protein
MREGGQVGTRGMKAKLRANQDTCIICSMPRDEEQP